MANCNGWLSRWSKEKYQRWRRSDTRFQLMLHPAEFSARQFRPRILAMVGGGYQRRRPSQYCLAPVLRPRNCLQSETRPHCHANGGRMGVPIRRRMERHRAAIRSTSTKRNSHAAALLAYGLARRDGLLYRLHDYLGTPDVPIEGRRRKQEPGPTFLGDGNGLLMDADWRRETSAQASFLCVPLCPLWLVMYKCLNHEGHGGT
jgi:hypothetical protein